ncbi:interferon-inducible GTPase 5-like [Paroedura picta]|uniref:interferon-inducible GTPase 5-like n=1 Tax=Paroedura picta TaxID=143630 RepID=UPI004056E333
MGSAISQEIVRDELGKMKEALDNNSLSDVIKQSNINLNLLKNTTLDVAITGVSGVGKSSLVNALRGMTDFEEGAAETGTVETTMNAKGYPHPTFPKVTIWDLPGIGTPCFKAEEYLRKVNFERYDFFMILSSERFTTNDILLAREICNMNKKFYYVCTKVDRRVNSARRQQSFNEERTLETIRKYYCANLAKAGEFWPRVFLICSWDLNKYDFPLLQKTLENDLDDLKRYALITTMPNLSREVLKRKKDAMEGLIWTLSLVSGAVGVIPIPGLSTVCDFGILVGTMIDFCKVFGLDEDSLHRLASRVGKPVPVLRSAIKKSEVANRITREFVTRLWRRSTVCRTMTTAEIFLDFIPVLGSVFGGIGSFATTFYMLKSFLNDVEEDAANVLAIATAPYPSLPPQRKFRRGELKVK